MSEPWFEIGDASEEEFPTILEIVGTASPHTFNALRSTASQRLSYVHSEFQQLKRYVRQGRYRFLVARALPERRVIGYLLLNLYQVDDLGRRQTFVEDIGAWPEYWGRGIGHALFDAATQVTAELGIDFMGGEVAASNPRWEAALRNNFLLESYRVVRPCTPRARQILEEARLAREAHERLEKRRAARERRRLET